MQRQVGSKIKLKGEIIKLDSAYPRQNGWVWFHIQDSNSGELCHISGYPQTQLSVGVIIECECIVIKYDSKYRTYSYELVGDVCVNTRSRRAIIKYLTSNLFQGIGVKTAEKLYDTYGDNTIDMLMSDFDTVVKTVQLSKKQIESLRDISKYQQIIAMQKAFPSLSLNVIQTMLADKTLSLGGDLVSKLKREPYRVTTLAYVPFEMADELLISDLQIPLQDFARLGFVFSHYMKQVMHHFHNTYVSTRAEWDMLAALCFKRPMPVSYSDANMRGQWVFNMTMVLLKKSHTYLRSEIRDNGDCHVYTYEMFEAKNWLISYLQFFARLNHSTSSQSINQKMQLQFHTWLHLRNHGLTSEQEQAILTSVTHCLSFISGGPGRGKTFVAQKLLDFWSFTGGDILMLAPTGRAVNKLKGDTNYENAETIARFLCMNAEFDEETFRDTYGNEMSKGRRTLIIIDEVSMLDFIEARHLLNMIRECTVVFLGDVNQLQPIEPGSFLHEVLKVDAVYPLCISYLTKNMRTNNQILADNSDKILDGTLSAKDWNPDFAFDFTFCGNANNTNISVDDADIITRNKALDYYQDALKNGCSYSDILLICPTRKGNAGTIELNKCLQNNLNPVSQSTVKFLDKRKRTCSSVKGVECPSAKVDGVLLRIMDRVIQTKNHPDYNWRMYRDNNPDNEVIDEGTGLFNGDVGTIVRYIYSSNNQFAYLLIQTDDDRFFELPVNAEICSELSLGYAITVHKAQGSEALMSIMVLSEKTASVHPYLSVPFLTKNLLYTGVTRAKQSVQILGSKKAFDICLQTEQYSGNATIAEDVIKSIQKNYVAISKP